MFDFYSQCTQHTRLVAYLHPNTPSTWAEAARQSHDADVDTRGYRASERPARFIRYLFSCAYLALQLKARRPSRREWVHAYGSLVEQDLPTSR